ncbi:RNA polymerase-associated protein RapA [Aliikangiella coralliicola]|uniref:RNA polymerase-associated protein RapA n=1 Tax=Aliikangiella coralliicola TaxID=2592383 RepID=A0A545UEN3_9GAMM|nr:RNA polymerase-associated protein RapA [Aliikangiella coralliicola]TQV87918.1 RNA polymerase-associated protein RapA [Aliikangiella coralliicola]
MTDFTIGQRWLSENETELGLGLVQNVDHRLVTVYFPACDDQRTYAKNNAPLSRVAFEVGEQIETMHGEMLKVERIEPLNGILVYMGKQTGGGDELIPVPETQLSHHLELNKASDRLFSGQIDSLRWFELRYAAMKAKEQQQLCKVNGLQGPRVDLIGHQLYIASEVGNRFAPRVLLADEVGLGKTIEAGMIIHQQLLNHRAQRVLIVVPQALVNQWFVEMIRRFNLHFSIFDQARIDSLISLDDLELGENVDIDLNNIEVENPYLSEQLVLCSSEFLAECDLNLIKDGEWELLVVDEAHHLEWSPEQPSKEYLRIETIARDTAGLLLLSATPEQLGQESHFARLRLLDPDRFHSLEAFVEEQQAYQPIAELVSQIVEQETWTSSLKQQISQYLDDVEICEDNRDRILSELLDRNGTGRVLYRNTRKNIKGFPKRKVIAHPVDNCEKYFDDVGNDLNETIAYLLHPETQYADESWTQFDPRIGWLKNFLKENRSEKILIICAHKDTAIALDLHCRFKQGINCCTFHEDMDIISRDRAAAHFADQEDGAQAMFCSEIGSEGRNFQFSHKLVLMDLPLNPDLLEQRIGRLDRIGQNQDIEIHVPFMQQSAQEVIFNWYHLGMNAFEKTNSAGSAIFKRTKAQLFDALVNHSDQSQQEALIKETQEITAEINQAMESGRDKLLELASFNQKAADQLVEYVAERDSLAPRAFMESCWDRFGVQVEDHSEKTYVIRPGDHMFIGSFPALPEDGITATYDRKTALSRDDIQFISWEHPMVSGAVDMVLSEDKGNASVCILKNKAIKAGTILMEVLYHIDCVAPKYLQAQRFLPYTAIRVLTDVNGNDLAEKVNHTNLSKQCQKIPKNTSRQVLKSEEKILRKMLASADKKADVKAAKVLDSVLTNMQVSQSDELNRLISLQKKNPNIRNDEIEFIKTQTQLLEKYLKDTQLQLEAVRVIVAV